MKMAFGKHRGEQIEDIPSDYLIWALENLDLPYHVQNEMENQLKMRRGEGVVRKKDEI